LNRLNSCETDLRCSGRYFAPRSCISPSRYVDVYNNSAAPRYSVVALLGAAALRCVLSAASCVGDSILSPSPTPVLPCPALPCPAQPSPAQSCLVLPCPAQPCPAQPRPAHDRANVRSVPSSHSVPLQTATCSQVRSPPHVSCLELYHSKLNSATVGRRVSGSPFLQ